MRLPLEDCNLQFKNDFDSNDAILILIIILTTFDSNNAIRSRLMKSFLNNERNALSILTVIL